MTNTVIVSRRFQVVIPHAIRKAMGMRPGQVFQVIQHGDRIELVPVRAIGSRRGILKGIDTSVPRDDDRD